MDNLTYRRTYIQTDRQKHVEKGKLTDRHTYTDRQTNRETDKHTDRQKHRWAYIHTDTADGRHSNAFIWKYIEA